jgi:hypothetical protein
MSFEKLIEGNKRFIENTDSELLRELLEKGRRMRPPWLPVPILGFPLN